MPAQEKCTFVVLGDNVCDQELLDKLRRKDGTDLYKPKFNYPYKSLKRCLQELVLRPEFEFTMNDWKTRKTKPGTYYDICDGAMFNKLQTTLDCYSVHFQTHCMPRLIWISSNFSITWVYCTINPIFIDCVWLNKDSFDCIGSQHWWVFEQIFSQWKLCQKWQWALLHNPQYALGKAGATVQCWFNLIFAGRANVRNNCARTFSNAAREAHCCPGWV